jgi:hypothetical protein
LLYQLLNTFSIYIVRCDTYIWLNVCVCVYIMSALRITNYRHNTCDV